MDFNNKKIYIEVGSNEGTDTTKFISEDSVVFCFEPIAELAYKLWQKFKHNNVIVLPFAVDIDNSFKQFNIAGHSNQGCSSLNKFKNNIHEVWPGRPDFNFTESYVVPTIRLDSFIHMYNITKIDYIWIDAQGHDFNVLKSLGNNLSIVQEGRCEAAYNIPLYEGVDNYYQNIIEFLHKNDFKTDIQLDMSGLGAECDVIFTR